MGMLNPKDKVWVSEDPTKLLAVKHGGVGVRLFPLFLPETGEKSMGKLHYFVDPRGIEPRPHPCHGRVIPLYYGPLVGKF